VLYFPKEPFTKQYLNEIFNKLCECNGYDIIKYLEFHYNAYENRADFLRFLHYEGSNRMNMVSRRQALKLESALTWVEEKQQEYKREQETKLQEEIQSCVREIVTNQSIGSPEESNDQIKFLSQKLSSRLEEIMATTERGMKELTGAFITGNVQLNNRNDENKIIQLFIFIQELQATSPNNYLKNFLPRILLLSFICILTLLRIKKSILFRRK